MLIAGLLSGCPSSSSPTATDEKKNAKEDLPPAKSDPPPATEKPVVELEPPVGPGTTSTPADPAQLADPPWFDTAKIEHAKVLQPRNQAKVGASTATAILLELDPGKTAQDCMAAVRTEMAKTVGDVAEAVPGDKGRLTVQGKTSTYSYTVVCGPGKDGQTTLYLSYTSP
jgi:hypothetical protein